MVLLRSVFVSAALLSGFVSALPTYGDSSDEVPVSAPDGTPTSEPAMSTSAAGYGGYTQEGYMTTSSEKSEQTMTNDKMESSMMEESSSMMYETMQQESTSTSSSYESMPTYGSGKSDWGSGYDDCVQKCVATYGAPPATYQPTATTGSEGSSGSGSTVTVIVAPTQGVLRFVPAAVNASVGTTIKFMWGAGPHTVTKGSALLPCNKSAEAPAFTSGQQEKGFVYNQVVNDTKPTFYFCGVPGHCQKGMFGMINPTSDAGAATSVGGMMQSMMANNSDLRAYATYTSNMTQGKPGSNWGSNISLKEIPEWAQPEVALNVMYTRNLLAMNPDIIKADGTVDLSSVTSTPLMIPQDIGSQLDAAGNTNSGAAGSSQAPASTGTTSGTTSGTAPGAQSTTNSASTMASPKVLVAVMAVVATFLAL
ncbi:hypothetical protein E1B28_008778 [Marasmius oreades]|uniref:Phytocyanin domain-containing protein n=1 Tax=Marasmius oreades TaxID=181124 RepID=A0A9P7RZQ1_9AGAR|nr:uncharacterized protein E1B28_008778 [Marasmius oreades]KAG7092422.1 hypothetical protein E1B28_008778 [Marasmius oreades]